MRWITRERPKIDRLACPWLIRRFIDPEAEFFYVPTAEVKPEAARLGATPYDIPEVALTHDGERCSFDAFLQTYRLDDPALHRLALIVRAADTDRLVLSPQAPGLLAITLGLGANILDDQALLQAAMPIYDALYTWCKSLTDEKHGWYPEPLQA